MRRTNVLVVDDDLEMLDLVNSLLGKHFDVQTAISGSEALKYLEDSPPDLVVLDLMMSGLDGFSVCRRIREHSTVPVIVLSGRTNAHDKVRALDLGADDYVTKPFSGEELVARVRAVIRRSRQGESKLATVEEGPLRIDFARRLVSVNDEDVRLTPTEYALLEELAANRGKLMTHATLLQRVWGPEYRNELDYLRVFIRRLRLKIEPDPSEPQFILTEARAGYRFKSAGPPSESLASVHHVLENQ